MSAKKKDPKAGKHSNSKQNDIYKAQFRRYVNAMKRIKRHVKHNPEDHKAKKWMEFMSTVLAMDYKRGNAALKKKWETLFV